jgi:hypothetical protein
MSRVADPTAVPPRHPRSTLFNVALGVALINTALVPVIAAIYGYDARSWLEAGAGFIVLASTSGLLWFYRWRLAQAGRPDAFGKATVVGLVLGLLWVVEIGINNFIAPPLPLRDHIDNSFWAAIALGIFSLCLAASYRSRSMVQGIRVGAWSGLLSGLLACWAALSLILFGMGFILRDPINVAEWAERGAGSHAPTMASYFAFETFAGAILHLVMAGLVMGTLLGLLGGVLGKSAGEVRRSLQV